MNPGDLVWVDFPGAVQTKRGPAVVLSSPTYHAARPDVILGLITSQVSRARGPTDLLQDWQQAGLRIPSAFRAYISTLPRSVVVGTIGSLSQADWDEVVTRMKLALKLN